MHIKNSLLCCTFLALIISTTPVNAADIAPALTTPDEQSRQRQLESQEQQRQQEILKSLRQQQEIKPDVRDDVDALTQVPLKASIDIPDNETPCFAINKIELVGDDAAKFQFALDEVLTQNTPPDNNVEAKPILGRCLGVRGINAVMNRVQNAIIARGYVTTRVLVAPQDLKAGLLQLTVIPGHVSAIRFTPDSSKHISMWNAAPINAGDILNLREIEQTLENLKRVPTADANIQIEPSSENKPGQSDVVIRYQQHSPLRLSVGMALVLIRSNRMAGSGGFRPGEYETLPKKIKIIYWIVIFTFVSVITYFWFFY